MIFHLFGKMLAFTLVEKIQKTLIHIFNKLLLVFIFLKDSDNTAPGFFVCLGRAHFIMWPLESGAVLRPANQIKPLLHPLPHCKRVASRAPCEYTGLGARDARARVSTWLFHQAPLALPRLYQIIRWPLFLCYHKVAQIKEIRLILRN